MNTRRGDEIVIEIVHRLTEIYETSGTYREEPVSKNLQIIQTLLDRISFHACSIVNEEIERSSSDLRNFLSCVLHMLQRERSCDAHSEDAYLEGAVICYIGF